MQQFFVLPVLDEMGRPRKTLLERVLDNSFRPGRYGPLLAEEPLPATAPFADRRRRLIWERLREQQANYLNPKSSKYSDEAWYRDLAAEGFGRYVCALHGSTLPWWLPLEEPEPRAPAAEPPPPARPEYVFTVRLQCEECERESDGEADGWVALLAEDPREDDLPTAAVFCPDCAKQEFGLVSGRSRGGPTTS